MKTAGSDIDVLDPMTTITARTTETAGSPFVRPPAFARRTFLAGLLGLGIVAAIETSPIMSRLAHATPPKLLAGSIPAQPGPYSVQASSELSDDAFATADVLIGESDQLLPFYNPFTQATEALVHSGSTLQHLRRDPTQSNGWAYDTFDLQGRLLDVQYVAIAANNDKVYALLFGAPDPYSFNNPTPFPYWLTWLDSATDWNEGFIPLENRDTLPDNPSDLKGGISPTGVPYFYTAVANGPQTNLVGWITTTNPDNPLQPQPLVTLQTDVAGTAVQDYLVLYDTAATNQVGYALVLTASGGLSVYPQVGATFSAGPLPDAGTVGITQLLWAWATPGSTSGVPGYVVQGNVPNLGEGTYFCAEDGHFDKVADTPGSGSNVVSVWFANGLYTVNLLDGNGVLQTIQQIAPGNWADPLPIANGVPGTPKPGLAAVFGVVTDPTRATLFAIGVDESLSTLSLDESGWTQTQLKLPNSVAAQLTCYRMTMTVLDANGAPVQYGQAQLQTDRPVALWQDIGSTILVPSTPVALTADVHGQIIVSMPAEELDAAVLTATAYGPSGALETASSAMIGDYDVRNFLGGTAALPTLGTMSPSVLTGAKNADSTPLFPGLTTSSATSLAGGMSQAIVAGNGAPPQALDLQAVKLEFSGRAVKLSTSRDARAFGAAPRREVELSISHLFDSVGHAVRHGLAQVKTAVVRWEVDAKQWVMDLETTINDLTTFVITGMRDAFHAIGGWFATLGADIKNGVEWLKREVFDFLSSVGKNATTIEALLSQGPQQLTTIVGGLEKQVDGWFARQEALVTGWITQLETVVEDATFGSAQPLMSPPTDSGSATAMNGLPKDIHWLFEVVNHNPGKWLYDKLTRHLPSDPGPNLTGAFDAANDALVAAFTGFVDDAHQIALMVWDDLKGFTTRDALTQSKVTAWFSQLNAIVSDVLKLCDQIFDAVLDYVKAGLKILDSYLGYEWSLTSIDPILKLILDKLGYDPTVSLNRLVSLVSAFPLTLVREIEGYPPVFVPPSQALAAGPDSGDRFCYITAAICQFLWTAADISGDFELFAKQGAEARPAQPGIIDYFDILCPLLETLLLLPGRSNNLIWNGLPTNTNLPGLIPPTIYSAIVTPIFKIAAKAKAANPVTKDPDTIPYYYDAPVQPDPLAQYYGPIVSMIAAIANTIMASWYADKNSSSTGEAALSITGTVLGNASNIASPLTTWWLNDSLADLPVIVKLVIDGVGGIGAGAIIGAEAPS